MTARFYLKSITFSLDLVLKIPHPFEIEKIILHLLS